MKKVVKLSLVASLIVGGSLSLNASVNTSEINSELLNKIISLEAQIKEIKETQSKSNDTIEERVDKIETSTMTDKIDFGVDFRTRADNFEAKDASGDKTSSKNVWSNRLRLNMNSNIADDMKFTGRLSMYKNWSDTGSSYLYSSMDPMQGRRPSDSGVFVERAYIDWTAISGLVPVTLTIGRQPSSDGPSHQFKDNTVRKATYSALSFDGAADGVVATANLQKITSVQDMALRVGYGKGYQDDTTYTYIGDSSAIKDTNVLGAFFDTGLGVNGSLLQLSVVGATDVVSNTTDLSGINTNTNIGDVMLYTAMLEFTNLSNSGLDLFAHYAISQSKPNGVTSNQATPYGNYPMGLLTNTPGDTEQKDGHAFWLGTRYTMPIQSIKNPKIGVEYNQGSENWFSFTQGSNSLTNKLATRGNALEVYYIQPINRYANLRFGAEMIDYDYVGSGYQIGTPMKVSDMGGTTLDKLNNYYLLFNLSY
ncbi:MAG: DUF3373 family protein [Sulfurimonas sp.]|nr:DUF3373 family protein [Sulfurimonas sp.]